jgi:hypothetical protein
VRSCVALPNVHCTAALLHCCTAALLHCCTAALLHCGHDDMHTAPLHCYTMVLPLAMTAMTSA